MDLEAAKTRLSNALVAWKEDGSGHTWTELCGALGVSRETIRLWKERKILPDLPMLAIVCNTLGIPARAVLFGESSTVKFRKRIEVSDEEFEAHLIFRSLPHEQQQEVITYMHFLYSKAPAPSNVQPIVKKEK